MKKSIKKILVCTVLCSMTISATAMAKPNKEKFSFVFEDKLNHNYPTSWLKQDNTDYYKITLSKTNGLKKNTLSESNIFGCKMKDMDIGPAADVYHTYKRYDTYSNDYQSSQVKRGHTMILGAKKDSDSTSGATLRVSGTVQP